jgi:uncharacterized protein (TIGR03083 family)
MPLSRQEVVPGLVDEYAAFRELLLSLDESEWHKSTRCEGWEVADVAAHVTGTLTEIINGRLDGLGDPERIQATVDERRGRTAAEVADELEQGRVAGQAILATFDDDAWVGPSPGGDFSLGEGVEALWYDTYVHAEDIRSAIGRPSETGPGLRASVSHLADLLTTAGWGPATLALDGVDEFAVSGGGGRRVTGDPLPFVLVATGRADPASLGLDETVNVYR